jgi:two-component system, chemotaxis family, chemotaxis protein CheV
MSDVHVQVRVGDELYALPVTHVLEIGEIGELTAAPGASRATLGVRNLRGDLLPVFDLAAVLGLPRSQSAKRMLVAERRGTRAGFAVDEVTDVEVLLAADQEVDGDLLSSAALIDGALVGVIDVDRLFDTLENAT